MVVILLTVAIALWDAHWAITLVVLALLFPAVAMLSFRVTVDQRGLTYRSKLGIPRATIAAEEIADVRLLERIDLWDGWGGLGYRKNLNGRGIGIVMNSGPAVEVVLNDGSQFTFTTPAAHQAAAALSRHVSTHTPR